MRFPPPSKVALHSPSRPLKTRTRSPGVSRSTWLKIVRLGTLQRDRFPGLERRIDEQPGTAEIMAGHGKTRYGGGP